MKSGFILGSIVTLAFGMSEVFLREFCIFRLYDNLGAQSGTCEKRTIWILDAFVKCHRAEQTVRMLTSWCNHSTPI